MKRFGIAILVVGIYGCAATGPEFESRSPVTLNTDEQKIAYTIGYQTSLLMREAIVKQDLSGNLDELFAGMRDGVEKADTDLQLSQDELQVYMQLQIQRLTEKAEKERIELEINSSAKEKEFFEAEANREEVSATESGILYEVLVAGSGISPEVNGVVRVRYEGWLLDGTRFDASDSEGGATQVSLSRVIAGWREVLPMMKEGDRWRIVVPYELAYGEAGAGNSVPPFSTLIFEIELVEVIQ